MKIALSMFDQYLYQHKKFFEAIIIGGAALNVMDIINRQTRDVDFLDPNIPDDIKTLSIQFAKDNPELALSAEYWINNGPRTLIRDLPSGWRNEIQKIFSGRALTLWTLGRLDLLRTKLYACADREIDFQDCIALKPTKHELLVCKEWVLLGDGNPLWKDRVDDVFTRIAKELKHEK